MNMKSFNYQGAKQKNWCTYRINILSLLMYNYDNRTEKTIYWPASIPSEIIPNDDSVCLFCTCTFVFFVKLIFADLTFLFFFFYHFNRKIIINLILIIIDSTC